MRSKSHKIGLEFLQLTRNTLGLFYEQMIKVGTNMEFKAGYIGIGSAKNPDNVSGMYFKAGVKFLKTPDEYIKGGKRLHALKGSYIKPEFIFNTFSTNYNMYSSSGPIKESITYRNYAFNMVLGKQFILGNIMTMDYYFGFGY